MQQLLQHDNSYILREGKYERAGEEEYEADGVVAFVLGARLNHPFGKLSPDTAMLDILFKNMWREAEKNNEKWGCKYLAAQNLLLDLSLLLRADNALKTWGKQSLSLILLITRAQPQSGYRIGVTLRACMPSLEVLFIDLAKTLGGKKYPYVGVIHETYHAPKGHHEAIYRNFDSASVTSQTWAAEL